MTEARDPFPARSAVPSALFGQGRWLIVATCFVCLGIVFSARSSLGLSMATWEAEFGWSRSFLSFGGAASLIAVAVLSPIAGALVDRRGPRDLLGIGLLAVGCGMLMISVMDAPWMFLLAFSGVAAIGFGTVANHVVATAVSLAFERGRGLAVGLATSGSTAGQLLLVPVFAAALATIGWRSGFAVLGVIAILLAPVAMILIGRRRGPAPARTVPVAAGAGPLRFLIGNPVFHALFWSFFICGFTTAGVIETHLLPYAAACGFPPVPSATAYGILSGFNMIGMTLAGWLTDRVNRPVLLSGIYILRALCFILLLFVGGDITLLFVFAILFGLFDYSTVPVTASLVAGRLGLGIMGLTMGILSAGHAVGAAAGAFLGGYLFDLFARYDWMWIASFLLAFSAGLIVLTIREDRMRGQAPVTAAA